MPSNMEFAAVDVLGVLAVVGWVTVGAMWMRLRFVGTALTAAFVREEKLSRLIEAEVAEIADDIGAQIVTTRAEQETQERMGGL